MIALELAGVALAALLSENMIFVSCLGIGTRTQSFRDPVDALRTGYCLTVVMVLGALCSWVLDRLVLSPLGWEYYRLLVFALLIPGIVGGLRLFIRECLPEMSRRMDGNLASISTNCAALGSALLFALFGGIGASIVLASFAALQQDVDLERCPKCFRGLPIQLITAGLMALALVGYYGLHLD